MAVEVKPSCCKKQKFNSNPFTLELLTGAHLAHEIREVRKCEGDGDVVGVVTPLVRGGAQVLHGDQVVELSVLLEVHEREEEGEDGGGQIEVEGEDVEIKESFRSQFSVVVGILFTLPVGDSKLRWLLPNFVTVTFAPNSF